MKAFRQLMMDTCLLQVLQILSFLRFCQACTSEHAIVWALDQEVGSLRLLNQNIALLLGCVRAPQVF